VSGTLRAVVVTVAVAVGFVIGSGVATLLAGVTR
jgi:hypothetical protein